MSNWAGGVLTAAGRTLQAKVEAGLTSLDITKIKLGDGTESMSAVDSLIDLVSPKVTMGVSSATQEDQTATIQGIITTSQIASGFYAREWGLFADDPDAGEILYMITIDSNPEWIPPSTSAAQISATYAMNIAVANATEITAQIDLAGLVDVEMLSDVTYLVKRGVAYTVGELAIGYHMKTDRVLICITAGTTSSAVIDWSQYDIGDTVTDGTVTWLVTQYLTKNSYIPGAYNKKETFTTSGTFVAPVTGTYRITLQGAGGGGGGGGKANDSTLRGGGGGGQGGHLEFYEKLTAGTSYNYIIGAGGSGGIKGSSDNNYTGAHGIAGGTSSIAIRGVSYEARGGGGGIGQENGYYSYGGGGGLCYIDNTRVPLTGASGQVGTYTTTNAMGGSGGGYGGGADVNRTASNGGGGAGGRAQNNTSMFDGSAGGDGYITFEYYDPAV